MEKIRDNIGISNLQYAAAGMFALVGVFELIDLFRGVYPIVLQILFCIGLIAACVGLFLSNRMVFAVGASLCVLRLIIYYIAVYGRYEIPLSVLDVIELAGWGLLCAAAWCKSKYATVLGLNAAEFFFLCFFRVILNWIHNGNVNVLLLLGYFVLTVVAVAIGLYLSSEKAFEVKPKSGRATVASVQTESNVDKIMKIHELMEAGIITKEEYEEKKRQIMMP